VRNKGVRAVDVPVSQLDVSKAQNVLDWSPGTGLGDGVVKTANWLRERL
jgi:nucleoside-diphosphate-sugar epimerase